MTQKEQIHDILAEAKAITSGDRQRDYGRPLINHVRIALKASVTLNRTVTPLEIAWIVGADLKSSREVQTPKYDNTLDDVGYARCRVDMINQIVELGIKDSFDDAHHWLHNITLSQMATLMELLWKLETESRQRTIVTLMDELRG